MSSAQRVEIVSYDERRARVTLSRIAEPCEPALVRHVAAVGAEQAVDDIRRGVAIGQMDLDGLQHRLRMASPDDDLAFAAEVGARFVCPGDEEWPVQLDDLCRHELDSFGLWVRGSASLAAATDRAIAVVGMRAASEYGVHIAMDFAADLAERGWSIVSGLAFGIDAAAHRGALAVGGLTVGVLATGIDVTYPAGNRDLYERMYAEGLVVTEHPPGACAQRPRVLVRNRIIAALSVGTLIVEAGVRSGARNTANHAARLNRHVMAVPGPITSSASAGCHRLLRERLDSVLVTRVEEVIEQCGHYGELAPPLESPATVRDALGPAVSRVLEGVPVSRPARIEGIANAAGVGVAVASAALAALASAGLVRRNGDTWVMTKAGRDDRKARQAPGPVLPFDWF